MDEHVGFGGRLGAYGDDELGRWEAAGSASDVFTDVLHAEARARFLLLAIGVSHGGCVERGLGRTEIAAALRLASTPAADHDGFQAKRLALREQAWVPPRIYSP